MADYGVQTEGFVYPSLDVVFEELKERIRARLGPGVAFTPDSPETFIVGAVAEAVASCWAAGSGVWFAGDPEGAADTALDNLASLTGTERLQAAPSRASVLLTGDAATVVEAGKVVSASASGTRFATQEAGTLAALSAWTASTTYTLGALVTNDDAVWVCAQGGSTGLDGPEGTTSPQTDGGVVWRYAGPGVAAVAVDTLAETNGPLPAPAYTITGIETPVAGWRGAANPADAVLGRDVETDASLRVRRRQELRPQGKSAPDAIRGRLLDPDVIDGVTSCVVFENEEATENADGVPGHAIEVLIEGGEDADIRAVIWDSKAAGIRTFGTTTGTTLDDSGNSVPVAFSRPTLLPVYVTATVNLTPDAPEDDAEAEAELLAAVVAYGQALQIGRNVVPSKLSGSMTALEWVDGVDDLKLGLAPAPAGTTTLVITNRQRASLDSTRIALTLNRLTREEL